jgi:hypothetical protein
MKKKKSAPTLDVVDEIEAADMLSDHLVSDFLEKEMRLDDMLCIFIFGMLKSCTLQKCSTKTFKKMTDGFPGIYQRFLEAKKIKL